MSELTNLLCALERGDPGAASQVLPLIYDDLRILAALKLAQERPGQTLQPTALVRDAQNNSRPSPNETKPTLGDSADRSHDCAENVERQDQRRGWD